MTIAGLQKLTLLDFPGRTACTVFTGGCNFRCPFCHNASLVLRIGEVVPVPEAEFFAYLEKRRGVLDGVCVTGGEPLLQPDLAPFLQRIKALGYAVKLDTNGSFPERLQALLSAELVDFVAMDIKNSPEKYGETVGCAAFDLAPVEASVRLLQNGTVPHEFRTTVVKNYHTAADFEAIGRWLTGASRYFLQAYVDSGDILQGGMEGYSKEELEGFLNVIKKYLPQAALRGI